MSAADRLGVLAVLESGPVPGRRWPLGPLYVMHRRSARRTPAMGLVSIATGVSMPRFPPVGARHHQRERRSVDPSHPIRPRAAAVRHAVRSQPKSTRIRFHTWQRYWRPPPTRPPTSWRRRTASSMSAPAPRRGASPSLDATPDVALPRSTFRGHHSDPTRSLRGGLRGPVRLHRRRCLRGGRRPVDIRPRASWQSLPPLRRAHQPKTVAAPATRPTTVDE